MNIPNKYFSYRIWKIYCSFFVAMLLQTILCFPKMWNICPSWVIMVLIYWVIISPYQVNVGTGFFLGLILDIFLGSIVGSHALSLNVITYVIIRKIYFFKNISTWAQSLIVIFFSLIDYSIVLLVTIFFIKITFSLQILWNCVLNGGMWPILVYIMHKICNVKRTSI